jgi:lipopolysaccharide export system permease protein
MRLRPLLHDQLVVRAVFGSLAITWIVLVAFASVLDFASQLDDLGKGGYSIGHVVLYIVCTTPRRFYDFFPTAALIGSLLGLGGLAATSELTALRSAGISRLRICIGAIFGLALVTAVMVLNAETLVPKSEQAADAISLSAKSSGMTISNGSGLWARDGNTFVNARAGSKHLHNGLRVIDLTHLRLFQFSATGDLVSMTLAEKAEYAEGRWMLTGVDFTRFADGSAMVKKVASMEWKSGLSPDTVLAGVERPRYQSAETLQQNIAYMHRNAVDASQYENAYWARWFYPLNVLALCLAALPLAFGQLRSGGFGKRLFIGIVCGLSFFVLQRFAQNLATIYHGRLWLAHLLPPLLALGASQLYFFRRRI